MNKPKKKHQATPRQLNAPHLKALNDTLVRIAVALEKIVKQGAYPTFNVGDNCAVAVGAATAHMGKVTSCHVRQDCNAGATIYGYVDVKGGQNEKL